MSSDTHTSRRRRRGALLVGFASLAAGVVLAARSPPEAYELSIYAGTPLGFWVGVGVALAVASFVGPWAEGTDRRLGLVLGGLAGLAVAALPVLRSYYFYGAGDSLTHLAWAKDLSAGTLSPVEFLYPGAHTTAVFLADATGIELPRAMLTTMAAFTAVFLLFVPLATWSLTRDRRATALAALSAVMLLPINDVSVFAMFHPTTQAIAFFPLILYLLGRYLTRADRDGLAVGTPTGALLALASVAVVLVHPQQAANVLVVFGSVLAVQLVARFVGSREADHRLVAFQTAFLAGVFLLWAPRHERANIATSALVTMLANGLEIGGETVQRAGSVAAVGGSMTALFLKLFLVSLAFCVLAGLLALGGLLGRYDDAPAVNSLGRYLGLAAVPIIGLFAAYFVVSYATLHFRQLGFLMAIVTILGAVALARWSDALSARFSPTTARVVVGLAVAVMLALSVPTVHESPYIYTSSGHVTEAQFAGYATAIEHRGEPRFVGVRGTSDRWTEGVLGYEESTERELAAGSLYANPTHPATGGNFTGSYLARHYDGRYLAYTDRLRQQETEVYEGFRFDRRGFRSLDATPGLNRVQANGDFQSYRINATK